ncbi:MAG: AAA family ATPase [Ignavibacteriaceae bacterium]|nr:AAA family ATPase [Ignavibacteriaceae bacterium]
MKTTIKIKNFRSLEDVEIELAPLTILVGPNGAGKSSLLKALRFIGVNLNRKFSSVPTNTIYKIDRNLDLGNYEQIVTQNELNREIVFELHIIYDLKYYPLNDLSGLWDYKSIDNFKLKLDKELNDELIKKLYEVFGSSNRLAKFYLKHNNIIDVTLSAIFSSFDGNKNLKIFEITNNTNDDKLFYNDFYGGKQRSKINYGILSIDEDIKPVLNKIINAIPWTLKRPYPDKVFLNKIGSVITRSNYLNSLPKKKKDKILSKLFLVVSGIYLYFPALFRKYLDMIHFPSLRKNDLKLKEGNKRAIMNNRYLDNFNLIPEKSVFEDFVKVFPKLRQLDFRHNKDGRGILLTEEYINQQREIKKDFSGTSFHYNLFAKLFQLRLCIGVYKKGTDIYIVGLNGGEFNYKEASSGLTQLFPIIADSVKDPTINPQISFIEQPELHLHPKLQAKLANILVTEDYCEDDPFLYEVAPRYIIETHSEHIIRAFQLRIAEKHDEPGVYHFYYFDQKDDGITKVIKLETDKLGNFITPWPNGFFDEAADLSMKLLEAQIRRN